MFRVLVTGSRDLKDDGPVYRALNSLLELHGAITVVHGDCPTGADRYARNWCNGMKGLFSVYEERYPADWDGLGKAAGPIRNQQMVATNPDMVLAFPRGKARGTMHCVTAAQNAGILVIYG